MCLVSNKIKFCTCDTGSIDEMDDYWVIYRFKERKDLLLMGMPVFKYNLHKEDYKWNVKTLIKRLNELDAFDTRIEFYEKDQLEIVFNKLSKDKNDLMTFNFQFIKSRWELNEDVDDFDIANHYDELVFGNFNTDRTNN